MSDLTIRTGFRGVNDIAGGREFPRLIGYSADVNGTIT